MNSTAANTVLMIVRLVLFLVGLVLLAISIWGNGETNIALTCALACIMIANVLNIICLQKRKSQ